jgi:nitroreductase
MDLSAAIAGRRSIREYTEQAVDDATIRRLVHAAILAPSAVNQQPWTFTVVRNQALLDQVSRDAKIHLMATVTSDMAAGDGAEHFRHMLADPAFQIFYHAPVLILISGNAPGSWITEDCTLAAENLMLTAHALGLGTCWIGFAQSYLNTPAGKRALQLPAPWTPVAPLIVGYPRLSPGPVPRKEPQMLWVD